MKIAIPWYSQESYNDAVCIMEDSPDNPIPYEDWLVSSEETVKRLENEGMDVVRVETKAVEFTEWCLNNGIRRDRDGRTKFAIWKLTETI